jgi:HK97 gp10 family phage protein
MTPVSRQVIYESKIAGFTERLKQAEHKLLHAIGQAVAGQAVLLAPVDTGNLANSIDYRTEETPQQAVVTIGTPVEYGIYQELGTYKMAAQPYLTPAINAQMDGIRRMAAAEYGAIDDGGLTVTPK